MKSVPRVPPPKNPTIIRHHSNFVESNDGSIELRAQARLLVQDIMKEDMVADPDLCIDEEEEECAVEDIVNLYYQERLNEMENEHEVRRICQDEEIEELKQMLEAARNEKIQQARNTKRKYREMRIPKKCEITIGKKRAQIFICHFYPEDGDLGIKIMKLKSHHHIFVKSLCCFGQASYFEELGPGLLLYEIVSSVPGQASGKRITATSLTNLKAAMKREMEKRKIITIKFLVPFPNMDLSRVHQRVMKHKRSRFKKTSRHNMSGFIQPSRRIGKAISRIFS
jgi:hypothetical protein